MKRLMFNLVGFYLLLAVGTKVAEQVGAIERCGCKSTCWCQRPGLSFFRWVFPAAHSAMSADEKATRAEHDG